MAIRVDSSPPAQVSATQSAQPAQSRDPAKPAQPADRRAAMQSAAPTYESAPGAQAALAPAQTAGARSPHAWPENIRSLVVELSKHPDAAKMLNTAFANGYA